MSATAAHWIYTMTVASVYLPYLAKVEKKGRTKEELDATIRWLTGYDDAELERHIAASTTLADFFAGARMNPNGAHHGRGLRGARRDDRGPAHAADPLSRQAR
jgi:hypothetical protein